MANDDEKPDNPAVGYGKPPMQKRFKKGESGNLKGRPKGSRNFSTVFDEELKSRIPITENGKSRTVTKGQAIIKQMINKAASGDYRAISIALNAMRQREENSAPAGLKSMGSSQEDLLVVESIIKRFQKIKKVDD